VEGATLDAAESRASARTLSRLVERGLVRRVAGQYLPVAPDVAADILLGPHERRLNAARQRIEALAAEYRTGSYGGMGEDVLTIYTGVHEMNERLAQVRSVVEHELRCLVRAADSEDCPDPDPAVACRAVLDWEPETVPASVRCRTGTHLPATLYLADDRMGVIPVRRSADAYAVVVHPGELLEALRALFEEVWSRARPIGSTVDAAGRGEGFDQLPELLLAGLTDRAIARQLGVGYRTVQRRIAMLMQDLGARTRFQAGVQAALREAGGD
jgi:hypothetical protein